MTEHQRSETKVRILARTAVVSSVLFVGMLVWQIHEARTLLPSSGFTLTEGQITNIREFAEWNAVRLTMRGFTVWVVLLGLFALLGIAELWRGARRWWADLDHVRSVVDLLAKTAAVVGVIAVLDVFALSPRLETTYVCRTLLGPQLVQSHPALRNAYGGKAPLVLRDAFAEWASFDAQRDIRTDPKNLLACVYDERARYERFKTEVIANVPDASLRPILRTAIEEHSFQWISLSLLNYGRGTAVDVSLAVPAAFEVVEGPKGVFDLEEGEALSWEMQTPKGEIEHDPTLEFNVGAGARSGRDAIRVRSDVRLGVIRCAGPRCHVLASGS